MDYPTAQGARFRHEITTETRRDISGPGQAP